MINNIPQPDQNDPNFTFEIGDLVITYEEVDPPEDLAKMCENNCRGLVVGVKDRVCVRWEDDEAEEIWPDELFLVFRAPS